MDSYESEEVENLIDERIARLKKHREGYSEKTFDNMNYAIMQLQDLKIEIQRLKKYEIHWSE